MDLREAFISFDNGHDADTAIACIKGVVSRTDADLFIKCIKNKEEKEVTVLSGIMPYMVSDIIEVIPRIPEIIDVKFYGVTTVVFWEDGTKTHVVLQDGDTYNAELAFAMCIIKKICGNTGRYNELFKKWVYKG